MFNFFRKIKERRAAAEAQGQAFKQILAQLQNGTGSMLEGALVLLRVQNNEESLSRFLVTFGNADLWILNKSSERLGEPVVTRASDGNSYVAAFTTVERAAAAAEQWKVPHQPSSLTTSELVFPLDPSLGIALNPMDPTVQWDFTPPQLADLRKVLERSHPYDVGGIYSVWAQGAYRVVKVLNTDEGGVHLRLYANVFPERPTTLDPATLTLAPIDADSVRSVGHMPVVRPSFLSMGPRLITTAPVTDDELEGYKLWAEAKGGYFGA